MRALEQRHSTLAYIGLLLSVPQRAVRSLTDRNQSCEASSEHTMGTGHWLMRMSTESPGRSIWRARPSKEQ